MCWDFGIWNESAVIAVLNVALLVLQQQGETVRPVQLPQWSRAALAAPD